MDAAALSRVALMAAADGNLRLLKKAAKQVDLRVITGADGRNALHVASAKGRLDICRFLIEDKEGPRLDVNSRSAANGHTPVLVAASEGHLPVLRYLLTRGGDPAMPGDGGLTPLHAAAMNGHSDAVRLLLSKGAPVDPLADDYTPMHFALGGDHHQALGVLLDHGANPSKMNHRLFAPLTAACGNRCLECIKLLVQAGADVNFTTPYGSNVLNAMVDACLPDIAELKEARADPNYPDKVALDDNLANIIKFLLEAGADANIPNEHGKIPMMLAAAWGPHKLVEILFPWTRPIPSLPDWNVDAIIRTMKLKAKDEVSVELEERLCNSKSKGKEAFTKGDYLAAVYFYSQAIAIDPLDATLFSNRSVSYLRMGKGQDALVDAERCRMMRPRWAKAWYRLGTSLSLLKGGHASYGKL
ncbi:hypothetical protein EJB05_37561 [Eragrostis curvula]|uniref:Serine/threonine-protein kinase BSK1-like TPR repeats domain-containing protein n=1 Tax=Eragrostis curvula TaxID=38414 RepID=A0A5J9TS67_9POAL|nr:hypothetical protein EJB05_37561 [Eragrostis curvula]